MKFNIKSILWRIF